MNIVRIFHLVVTLVASLGTPLIAEDLRIPHPDPTNTVLVFDLDDVILTTSHLTVGLRVLGTTLSFNPHTLYKNIITVAAIKSRYTKDKEGHRVLEYHNGTKSTKINGSTYQLLYHGMQDPRLQPFVSSILEAIYKTPTFIPGMYHLLEQLKNKGYIIGIATNKDRRAYDSNNRYLDNKLNMLVDFVVVAEPGNDESFIHYLHTTPVNNQDFAQLVTQVTTQQETEKIYHAHGRKPDYHNYFTTVEHAVADAFLHKYPKTKIDDVGIVFVDDRQENIDSTCANNKKCVGITFKNPFQFAQALVAQNVLSYQADKQLLEELELLEYPMIQRMGINIWHSLRSFLPIHAAPVS